MIACMCMSESGHFPWRRALPGHQPWRHHHSRQRGETRRRGFPSWLSSPIQWRRQTHTSTHAALGGAGKAVAQVHAKSVHANLWLTSTWRSGWAGSITTSFGKKKKTGSETKSKRVTWRFQKTKYIWKQKSEVLVQSMNYILCESALYRFVFLKLEVKETFWERNHSTGVPAIAGPFAQTHLCSFKRNW